MVKINAGSVHRAINNLGFFTTLAHLFKKYLINVDDITNWRYLCSGLQKTAAYTVQQPFPCFTVFIRLVYKV